MMHLMSKAIAVITIALSIQTANAIECGPWWMTATCRPEVGAAPSDSIWNPLLGDQQVVKASAANYAIGAYMSLVGSLMFGNNTDQQMLADYGPGIGAVSNSPQAMYKRFDVYDADCECMKSMLQRIQ